MRRKKKYYWVLHMIFQLQVKDILYINDYLIKNIV